MFELLGHERFAGIVEACLPAHRHRRYTPLRTRSMFVGQTLSDDGSCRRTANDHIARCVARDEPAPSSFTGAYCDARQRLPIRLIEALCAEVAREARRLATHPSLRRC